MKIIKTTWISSMRGRAPLIGVDHEKQSFQASPNQRAYDA